MKRIIILIVVFLQIFSHNVYAGDEPEVYLSEDNARIFTAIITNITRETIDVKVIRKIKGDILENTVLTLPYFQYDGRKHTKPQVDECCLITTINDKLTFSIQITSTDPKTLMFLNHTTNISMNMDGKSVHERIEQYVNDGTYEAAEQRRLSKLVEENVAKTTQTASSKNIIQLFTVPWVYVPLGILVSAGLLFVTKSKMKG